MSRYLAFALVLFAASSAAAAEKTVARTFTVTPGGMLTVDADSASVQVSATDTSQVAVRLFVRGSDSDVADAKLDAFQNGDGVNVTMRLRGKGSWFRWHSWNDEARIEVTVT